MNFADYIWPIVIVAAFYIVGELINFIITGIEKVTSKTATTFDEVVLDELKSPIRFVAIFLGLFVAVQYANPDLEIYGFSVSEIFIIAGILIGAHIAVRVITTAIRWYRAEVSAKKFKSKVDETLIPFIRRAVAIGIYIIAIIVIFDRLGIEIGPFLAGLGIAGLAVALALQDTLSNIFSGIYIATDRPIKLGDFVELDIGENYKGYVDEISWRTTRIRTLGGNYIVLPNSKLSQSVLTNYSAPKKEMSLVVPVGVAYGSDLDKVEKVTIEVAKKIHKKEEGAVDEHEPFIRYREFADSSINFSVILRVKSYVDKFKVQHEFIKELHKAYKKNKIEIPFPQRVVWRRK